MNALVCLLLSPQLPLSSQAAVYAPRPNHITDLINFIDCGKDKVITFLIKSLLMTVVSPPLPPSESQEHRNRSERIYETEKQ